MGGKRTGHGKFFHFCIAGLILLLSLGCALSEKLRVEKPRQGEAYRYLDHGRELLAQGDYEGSLSENLKVVSLATGRPPENEALLNIGMIYAHPENPKRDYGQSIKFFRRLVKDFPQSPRVEEAKLLTGMLSDNEKLSRSVEELKQVIEKSKQVDLEIEQKKREKGK
jgi:tetratricopeptide (TPR) repeat protein